MARCDKLPAVCLAEDIVPVLGQPARLVQGTNDQWLVRCPAHPDAKPRSMKISTGDRGRRIVWHCYSGCGPAAIRTAIILRSERLDDCLDRIKDQQTADELRAALLPILKGGPDARAWLDMAAIVLGRSALPPRGPELVDFAAQCGIGARTVRRMLGEGVGGRRRARRAGVVQPRPQVSKPAVTPVSSVSGKSQVSADLGARREWTTWPEPGQLGRKRHPLASPNETRMDNLAISVTRCEWCGAELAALRAGTRYCTPAHRQAAYRARRKDNAHDRNHPHPPG
jgi:hypothetical protein